MIFVYGTSNEPQEDIGKYLGPCSRWACDYGEHSGGRGKLPAVLPITTCQGGSPETFFAWRV